jgi:hypothetical protein
LIVDIGPPNFAGKRLRAGIDTNPFVRLPEGKGLILHPKNKIGFPADSLFKKDENEVAGIRKTRSVNHNKGGFDGGSFDPGAKRP